MHPNKHLNRPVSPPGDAAGRAFNPLVVIPARMGSSRLPGKPLALMVGEPMIVHVWRRAVEADVGPVIVAADDRLVVEAVTAAGGRAVMTPSELASGTDRVHAALAQVDPDGVHDAVLNLQGDLPTMPLDFSRGPVAARGTKVHHHIGAYAYRRAALERFVGLPPAPREIREGLEQLRALAAGMTIRLAFVDSAPIGVDTAADLDRARAQVGALNISQPG